MIRVTSESSFIKPWIASSVSLKHPLPRSPKAKIPHLGLFWAAQTQFEANDFAGGGRGVAVLAMALWRQLTMAMMDEQGVGAVPAK